ncbi:MAG TPA: hypothetical protein VJV79_00235 [Polyangiaceae bacterium]|nr:hypothetical protein [Polyangiaceae bacterium]
MNRFASLVVIALLAAGCASKSATPSARTPLRTIAHDTPPGARVSELRHFYLLSPGPGAKLVVTRSDVVEVGQR